MNNNGYVLLTGSANIKLARDIASILKKPVHEIVSKFSDGEKRIVIPENLRRRQVYIIQPTSPDVDSHIMELLFMIDAAKRASASEITAVVPYFGYARQDRKDRARVPISSALIAELIEHAGAHRIVTIDIHAEQAQGFIRGPWDNLYSSYTFIPVLKHKFNKNLVIASPDKGGVLKTTFYAEKLNADGIAIVFKERDVVTANRSKALDMIGNVRGKDVLLVDDMIDTAGTLCGAAELIMQRGAKSISAVATHGVFSGPALRRINKSPLQEVYVTDTVPLSKEALKNTKIKVVSIAKLLAQAIQFSHEGESLSERLIPKTRRDE